MRRNNNLNRAKYRSVKPRIETLESRQMLTASPELLVDLNTDPARTFGHRVLWESESDQTVWAQNVPGEGRETVAEITFIESDGGTSSVKIEGSLINHSILDENLYLEVSKDEGTEIWVTDGTAANTGLADTILPVASYEDSLGLVRVNSESVELRLASAEDAKLADVGDLSFDSFLDSPIAVGERLYFRLQRLSGAEIWYTDGTTQGTGKLATGQNPAQLFGFQNHLVFKAGSDQGDRGVMIADLSGEIRRMRDTNGEPLDSNANLYGASEDLLFGTTLRSDGQVDYWVADASLVPGEPFRTFSDRHPSSVEPFLHGIQFRTDGQLWRTDGTPEGTFVESPAASSSYVLGDREFELIRSGNVVELWMANSENEPTRLATDLDLNSKFIDDEGGKVYFVTHDQLWSTDGTVAGTTFSSESILDYKITSGVVAGDRLVAFDGIAVWSNRIGESPVVTFENGATISSSPNWIGRLGEINFYTTRVHAYSSLWAVDSGGAAERVFEGIAFGQQVSLTVVGDWAYFLLGTSFGEGYNLMRTQGTTATTEIVGVLPRGETEITAVGDQLFGLIRAVGKDGSWSLEDGSELWSVSGPADELVFVARVPANRTPLPSSSDFAPVSFGGRLYFSTFDSGLWESDGTAEGTRAVDLPDFGRVNGLSVVGEELFFVGRRENDVDREVFYLDSEHQLHVTGIEIAVSDFTMKTLAASGRYVVSGQVFNADGNSTSILTTDGKTVERLNVDFHRDLTAVGETLFYSVRNENRQVEYYSTDGTQDGTQLYFRETVEYEAADLGNGSVGFERVGGDTVRDFASDESHVYLMTENAIWKSDGTAGNTIKIAEFSNVSPKRGSGAAIIPNRNGDVHLIASNPQFGEEIFRVPGTPAPIVGDVDEDFDVDFADFLVMSQNYGMDVDQAIMDGDLDANGTVDFADFLLMAENFGKDLKRPL